MLVHSPLLLNPFMRPFLAIEELAVEMLESRPRTNGRMVGRHAHRMLRGISTSVHTAEFVKVPARNQTSKRQELAVWRGTYMYGRCNRSGKKPRSGKW